MKALLVTGVNEKLLRFDVRQLVEYINSTRSDDGGYCFYRLNESNAADTFYAVYVLIALNLPVPEPELTADFLQQRQDSDGAFQSIYSANYVLRTLDLLGVPPLFDPDDFLHRELMGTLSISQKPYYELSNSFLQSLGRAVAILALRREEPSPEVRTEVVAAVRPYKRPEGGFGVDHASIYSTYNAGTGALLLAVRLPRGRLPVDTAMRVEDGGILPNPYEYAQLPR